MISSAQNDKVKWLGQLRKSNVRKDTGLFLVEGLKEIKMALAAGFRPHSFYYRGQPSQDLPDKTESYELSDKAYAKIAYRDSEANNIVGVFQQKAHSLDELKLSDNPFIIIVESIEKPGNLGAILRIADGAGADAVIVADETTDIYNPNVVRSSVGCLFSVPIATASNPAVQKFCNDNQLSTYAAALTKDAAVYTEADFTSHTAIVLGTEATGLSDFWLDTTQHIIIPMKGKNDSLNVSTAAAVLAYEVVRQRQ